MVQRKDGAVSASRTEARTGREHSRPTGCPLQSPISIYDDHGAFVTLYPNGLEYKLTVGVERDAMAIGAQWVTLDAQQFTPPYTPFAVHHAPARNWVESQDQVDRMREAGYLRGMSSANTMIADGERWISGVPPLCCPPRLPVFVRRRCSADSVRVQMAACASRWTSQRATR